VRRRHWIVFLCVLAIIPIAVLLMKERTPVETPPPAEKHNVVLVTIDALRQDYLGCFGGDLQLTPRLDHFAGEAVQFEDPVTAAPLTAAGLASILTGRLPIQHRLRTDNLGHLSSSELMLPEILAAEGYQTGAFLSARLPLNTNLTQGCDTLWAPVGSESPSAEAVSKAIAWLNQTQGEPVFTWIHISDPRGPWRAPYPWSMRHLDNPYAAEVAAADETFGRLIDELRSIGQYSNSHIIVLSPTGEAIGDAGEVEHGILLSEATISIPWLWHLPGSMGNTQVAGLVSTTDFAPTLLDFLDIEYPPAAPRIEGTSLVGSIETGGVSPRQRLLIETIKPRGFGWAPLFAIRKADWKLIVGSQPRLYDLVEAPSSPQIESKQTNDKILALKRELGAEIASVSPEEKDAVNWTNWGLGQPNPYNQVKISTALIQSCRALQMNDPVTARSAASNLALQFPDNPRIVSLSALIHASHGDLVTAEKEFRAVLNQVPGAAEARLGLIECLLAQGRSAEARGAFGQLRPESLNEATWLLVDDPDFSFRLAYARGVAEVRTGDIAASASSFSKATALAIRQSLRNKAGQKHQAARFLDDLIRRDSYLHTPERTQVARAALQLGTPQIARDLLRLGQAEGKRDQATAAPAEKSDPLTLLLDAREAVSGCQVSLAARLVEKAIDANVATAPDCLALAAAFESQGRRDETIAILRQGLSAFPQSAEIHFQLARLLAGKHRQEERALIHLEAALTLGFRDWERLAATPLREMCQLERISRFWAEIG